MKPVPLTRSGCVNVSLHFQRPLDQAEAQLLLSLLKDPDDKKVLAYAARGWTIRTTFIPLSLAAQAISCLNDLGVRIREKRNPRRKTWGSKARGVRMAVA